VKEARLRVPLRRRDVDELGHLNQAVYHELLEEGRAALFAVLADGDAAAEGRSVLVAWDRAARSARELSEEERAGLSGGGGGGPSS
jgi:acyl-CoA thioesterase FadM